MTLFAGESLVKLNHIHISCLKEVGLFCPLVVDTSDIKYNQGKPSGHSDLNASVYSSFSFSCPVLPLLDDDDEVWFLLLNQ